MRVNLVGPMARKEREPMKMNDRQKANRALLDLITKEHKQIEKQLKALYVVNNSGSENTINNVLSGVRRWHTIFFDLLIDEMSAREILNNQREG